VPGDDVKAKHRSGRLSRIGGVAGVLVAGLIVGAPVGAASGRARPGMAPGPTGDPTAAIAGPSTDGASTDGASTDGASTDGPGGWARQATPEPAVRDGDIFGVSCTAPHSCTAVGRRINSLGVWVTLAEAWNGTSWEVRPTPNPTGSTQSELEGVSCPDAAACWAVGFFTTESGRTKTLAEGWNGTSWIMQATPDPKRASDSELDGVSCTATDACTAVGSSFTNASAPTVTLAEAWNGSSWSMQTTPTPIGGTDGYLQGVSCTATDACTAVGYSLTPSGSGATLAEGWDGTSWSVRSTPVLAGALYDALSGVSCITADACTAVGSFSSSTENVALVEVWDGTSWEVQASPVPRGAEDSSLSGVSCIEGGECTAVGVDTRSSGKTVTLAEERTGSAWTVQTTPDRHSATRSYLLAVSCRAGDACTSAGYDITYSGIVAPVAEAWNGNSWTREPVSTPAGAITSELTAVSCASTDACTAVGSYYIDTSGVVVALAERWNGSAWALQTTPDPAGSTLNELSGISCAGPATCTAVGYASTPMGLATLAEAWNGASWVMQTTPTISGASSSELSGVSCTAADSCTAVGHYVNSAAETVALAEAWNGTAWKLETTATPAGTTTSELSGVSCAAGDACTAVGSSTGSSNTTVTLAEAWNGSSWKIEPTPAITGAVRGSSLQGVSCRPADTCTSVGSDTDSSGVTVVLVEAWTGSSWVVQNTPTITDANESELSGVSCAAAGACTAAGFSTPSGTVALVEAWNGSSWEIQPTPNVPGAPVSELSSISCTARLCTAVGFHTKSSGIGAPLAETDR
jgi:hypothetical protein